MIAAEKAFHAYGDSGNLGSAIAEVWHGRDRNRILATILCVALAFTAYNLFSVINRRLAGGRLVHWLLARPGAE